MAISGSRDFKCQEPTFSETYRMSPELGGNNMDKTEVRFRGRSTKDLATYLKCSVMSVTIYA